MRTRIDTGLLARVQQLLTSRNDNPLPRPEGFVRPELQVRPRAEADGGGTELLLYDEISWWGVMAVDVAATLSTLTGPLHVRINSPGGDVFDGIAIYNMIADYPDQVTVTVDGLAASAASFIAMAGDTIRMNRASQMMIHDASAFVRGNAADMRATAGLLDTISDTIAGLYAARAGGEVAEWRERMLVDGGFGTWFTGEQAVEAGLADELTPAAGDEGQGGGENVGQAAVMERLTAALFPYGISDRPDRPTPATHAPADHGGQTAPMIQAPTSAPRVPVATSAPVEPERAPAPVETAEWADLVGHLTTAAQPSADDLLASLRETQ